MSPADNARADGLPGPLPSSPDGASRPERIVSVDALRGFDMFWIIGGEQVAEALDKMGGPAEILADVSGTVSGSFAEGRNLAHYVDFRWLPGRKRNLYYTNEGLLSTIPAVATTLFGIMAGWLLTDTRRSGRQKVAWLLAAGAAGIALGCLWGLQFPVIKRIWTSSFCLVASGASAVALAIFYLVVDVWRWRKWCQPLLWIGANALTAYLAVNLVDFRSIAARFVGGDVQTFFDAHVAAGFGGLVVAVVGLLLPILLVRFLYQERVSIRL